MSEETREAPDDERAAAAGWYLETVEEEGRLRQVRIHRLPFRIGREIGRASCRERV